MFKIYLTFWLIIFKNQSISNTSSLTSVSNNSYCSVSIKNCLSCKESKCLFCDVFDGFYGNSDNSSCVKCNTSISNCSLSLSCGACQICNTGYTLCAGACKANIQNCTTGNACTNVCTKCDSNYYLDQGNCSSVANIISDCLEYDSSQNCITCNSGFSISSTNGNVSCNLNSTNSSTSATSNIATSVNNLGCFVNLGTIFSCNSCIRKSTTNQYLFYDFEITNPLRILQSDFINNQPLLNSKILNYNSYALFSSLVDKNNVCNSKLISNCLETNENNKLECVKCRTDYYIFNGTCIRYLQNSIKNCVSYSINTEFSRINGYDVLNCTTCTNGYFFNSNICEKFTIIPGCLTYNNERNQCNSCDNINGYILKNNTCSRLQNFVKVDNCSWYNEVGVSIGKCASCKNIEYYLINNRCEFILNCSEVRAGQNNIECVRCKTNYILSSNNLVCNWVNKFNCWETSTNSNNCAVCNQDFFPVSGNCSNQRGGRTYISNCEEGLNNYNCRKCSNSNQIVPTLYFTYPVIENCLFHAGNTRECYLCSNNLSSNLPNYRSCEAGSEITNCFINYNSRCIQCIDTMFISGNNCVFRNKDNSNDLCLHNVTRGFFQNRVNTSSVSTQTGVNGTFPLICRYCVLNNLLVDLVNQARCVPRLNPNSTHPYQDSTCSSNQIRTIFYNRGNNILTCRSISNIVGLLYKEDRNCYIYKSSLSNYTNFVASTTLCAICKSGFSIKSSENYCTKINNCISQDTNFGGCTSCETGYMLDINGIECVTSISFCKVIQNDVCVECNDGYYSIILGGRSFNNSENGSIKYLNFYNNNIRINFRDSNNIQIRYYKWFYFERVNRLSASACSNSTLNTVAQNRSSASSTNLTASQLSNVLGTFENYTYPVFCKKGSYFKLNSDTNTYSCENLTGSIINNLPDNIFLNLSISRRCEGTNTLFYRRFEAYGPFCISTSLITSPVVNCLIYTINISSSGTISNISCLFCESGFYTNSDGSSCDSFTSPSTDIVTYCFNHTNGRCNSCPTGMSFVNNACVNSSQLLWTGGSTITQYMTTNNCNRITWNQAIAGYKTAFTLVANNNDNIVNCLECNNNFVMNYDTLTCVEKNLFNFSDCISTQNNIGCVSCLNGKISFGADYQHQLCLNTPDTNSFLDTSNTRNCKLYNYINNKFICYTCNTGYSSVNGICKQNILNCKTLFNENTCNICNNGYYVNTNGICTEGKIKNCLVYSNGSICLECETNYVLFGSYPTIICLDTRPILQNFPNCQVVKSQINSKILYCANTIFRNGFLGNLPLNSREPFTRPLCLSYSLENCITVDESNLLNCNQCKSEQTNTGIYKNNKYIWINNSCVLRNNNQLIPNCLVYNISKVECITCFEGFYKDRDNKCAPNPFSDPNCKYNQISNDCPLCNPNFYLNRTSNLCVSVNSRFILSNCYKYDSEQNCIVCNKGYLMNFILNKCEELSISTFIDLNNSCVFNIYNGYPNNRCTCAGKQQYFNNTTKRCINISNCIEAYENGSCKTCSNNYYYNFNSNECLNVDRTISNCISYLSNGICSRCSNNYSLKNNICELIQQNDIVLNCNDYSSEKKCILCNPGKFNDNGKCVDLNNNIMFSLYNDKSIPLICKTKYYMNKNRVCISDSISSSRVDYLKSILFIYIIFFI